MSTVKVHVRQAGASGNRTPDTDSPLQKVDGTGHVRVPTYLHTQATPTHHQCTMYKRLHNNHVSVRIQGLLL